MTCTLYLAMAVMVAATPDKPLHVQAELHEFHYPGATAVACDRAFATLQREGALHGVATDGLVLSQFE